MDAAERDALIVELKAEVVRSLKEALKQSRRWQRREAELKSEHGRGTPSLRIAKRDDLELKDAMAAYIWHRDNSNWAATMIGVLRNG